MSDPSSVVFSQHGILQTILSYLPYRNVQALSTLNKDFAAAASAALKAPSRSKISQFTWHVDRNQVKSARFWSNIKSDLHDDLLAKFREYLEGLYVWPGTVCCLSSLDMSTLAMHHVHVTEITNLIESSSSETEEEEADSQEVRSHPVATA